MSFIEKYLNSDQISRIRINGEYINAEVEDVSSPFSGSVIGKVGVADENLLSHGVDIAFDYLKSQVALSQRAEVLDKCAIKLQDEKEGFAQLIASEAAKPIATARIEVERAIQTFLFSGAIARTHVGEMVSLEAHPSGHNRLAFTLREPIGVVAAISPFNFPLNLVAHKLAPAIAAGCPIVLKPAMNTPLTSAALVDLLIDECGLDPRLLSFIPCPGEVASSFAVNEKVAMISFTGSPGVGWSIREAAPRKKVALELGNNAPVIIDSDTNIEKAASAIATSGYSFQGQSCISVQRVYVDSPIENEFVQLLKEKVEQLVVGDPLEESTNVSALISSESTDRVMAWIDSAKSDGASLVTGGIRENEVITPTVLINTTDEMDVCRREVFGPVVSVMKTNSLEEAISRSNNTSYGLHAAIFTNDISKSMKAAHELDFGGVLINETPTYRADNMPYGGIRDSGNTKEGPAYTVQEMTKEKLIVISED